jgi:hypothetical protein
MCRRVSVVLAFAGSLLFLFTTVRANQPKTDYWPTCSSPQNIAPATNIGGNLYALPRTPLAWNGLDYGTAWVDVSDFRVHFRRYYADGTPQSAGVVVQNTTNSDTSFSPALVWNGSGYGLAWIGLQSGDADYQVYFARLDADGNMIGSPLKVSFVGQPETGSCAAPALAWNGSDYVVVWYDTRNNATSGEDVFATAVGGDGSILGSGAYHDIVICDASNSQVNPAVAWNTGLGAYEIVWEDFRNGANYDIWGRAFFEASGSPSPQRQLVATSNTMEYPALADSGNGLSMVWTDYRDGNPETYFNQFHGDQLAGTDTNLSNNSSFSIDPMIVWTGAEFGVFWADNKTGYYEIYFQRVSADGVPQAGNVEVTQGSGGSRQPVAGFGRYGYLVSFAGTQATYGTNYIEPFGCNYAYTPTCPSGVMAYGVSSTAATISWQPVDGNGTDIAYYEVLRDNMPVGKTSNNYFTDTGLTSGTTYLYSVITVNAAQQQSYGCSSTTSSVYVKPSAAVTLKVNKSNPDAVLSWTDTSNMTSYNVYRGTNPQVMQKLGSTSSQTYDDANALTNSNVYFYTVDDPGQ